MFKQAAFGLQRKQQQIERVESQSQRKLYVSITGNDSHAGTLAEPFASISQAASVARPGDEIIIRGGTYRQREQIDDLHGTAEQPITIRNQQDEEVVFSGSQEIANTWTQHEGNIWTTTVDTDITQLFLNGKMLTAARWPNITTDWDYLDPTHNGELPERNYFNTWARNTTSNIFGVYHNNEANYRLTDLNISLEGAMLVPKKSLQRFNYTAAEISMHEAGSNAFELEDEAEKSIQSKSWKNENSEVVWDSDNQWARGGFAYYITNHLDLLDSPAEWHYEQSTGKLYVWLPDNQDPNEADLKIEARAFAKGTYESQREIDLLTVSNSSHLQLKGLNIHTGSFYLNRTTDTTIEDSRFLYVRQPGYMLGSDKRTSGNRTYNDAGNANLTWRNCEFGNSYDGMLTLGGLKFFNGITIENSYFHNIARGSGFISARNAWGLTLTRSTVHTGAYGGVMQVPRGSEISYNHFYGFYFDGDDSVLQVPGNTTIGTRIHHNWIHNAIGRNGIRFDGNPAGIQGTAHHNVLFANRRGSRWKGDQHTLISNLAFGNSRYDIGVSHDKFYGYDANGNSLKDGEIKGNETSIVHNNAGNNSLPIPVLDPNNHSANWRKQGRWLTAGIGVSHQLMDPNSFDFRPAADSDFIDAGTHVEGFTNGFEGAAPDIGAYEAGTDHYWIPGHRTDKARRPVPVNGTTTRSQTRSLQSQDADLMWLEGKDAVASHVYFGTDRNNLVFQGSQTSNIFDPGQLKEGQTYYWRIDSVKADDSVITGDLWSFKPELGEKIIIPSKEVGDVTNVANAYGYGAVGYAYHISEREISNAEYATFLTSIQGQNRTWVSAMDITKDSGTNTYSAVSGKEDEPVGYISFWDAARFANWLTTGDTESGVYNLDQSGMEANNIQRDGEAWAAGGVAVANLDELQKAMFYSGSDNGADGDGYWHLPTQANASGEPQQATSYYGLIDNSGWEWSETIDPDDATKRFSWATNSTRRNQWTPDRQFGGRNKSTFRLVSLQPIGNGFLEPENSPPAWLADQWSLSDAQVGTPYTDSLKTHAIGPEDELLTFTKLSGPDWLKVGTDGELSGTPSSDDVGVQGLELKVTDPGGLTADTAFPVRLQVLSSAAPAINGVNEGDVVQVMENGTAVLNVSAGESERVSWSVTGVDGAHFSIDGSGALIFHTAPDWEAPSDADTDNIYQISIIATNNESHQRQVNFVVEVLDDNVRPEGITLSTNVIPETTTINSVVGTLSSVDLDLEDTHTYVLVDGIGSDNNNSFTLSGDQLILMEALDHESNANYSIRVSTTDNKGLSHEQELSLVISDENEVPTDVQFTSADPSDDAAFNENIKSGTFIGTLSTSDPDQGDSFSYSLVAGEGNLDNTFFSIDDNQLTINHSPDFESKSNYEIRVRAVDPGGLSVEKKLALAVLDRHEVVIPTVIVGNEGNQAVNSEELGSVNYAYHITSNQINNAHYATFLNDVAAAADPHRLFSNNMQINRGGSGGNYTYTPESGEEEKRVHAISFMDAIRFANWLTTGDTEGGVYDTSNPINRNINAWNSGGVAVMSETEYYKAAYYSGTSSGADGDGYWSLPTQSNTPEDASGTGTSFYGLNKTDGYEWTDTQITINDNDEFIARSTSANSKVDYRPTYQKRNTPFRLTSLEPIGNGLNSIVNFQPEWQTDDWVEADHAWTDNLYSYSVNDRVSDSENDNISFSKISGPDWITVGSNGIVSGIPRRSDAGLNSVVIRAIQASGLYHDTPIPLTISVRDSSTLVSGDLAGSSLEGSTISGTLRASDPNGLTDGSYFTISSQSSDGSATIDATTGLWSYTPTGDFHGTDVFTVTITDDDGGTTTQDISLSIAPVDDAATLSGETTGSGPANASISGTLIASDIDGLSDGSYFSITTADQPDNGTASIHPSTGRWTYTPEFNYTGSDFFLITITDDLGGTTTQVINLSIGSDDVPAIITGETTGSGPANAVISGTLIASDIDGLSDGSYFAITIAGQPDNGKASIDPATGRWTYTPELNHTGSDSFLITITDDLGGTTTQVINLSIGSDDVPAIITGDTYGSGDEDSSITGILNASDADGLRDGSYFSIAIDNEASRGKASIDPVTGIWSYTPETNIHGSDSFTVTISDDLGGTTSQAINLSILPVDDAGSIEGDISGSGPEDISITGRVKATDIDGLTDGSYFTLTTRPEHGSASIDPVTGSWSFVPYANIHGNDVFSITLTDDLGGTTHQIIPMIIRSVDDPASISGDLNGTGLANTAITGRISASDPDGLSDGSYFSIAADPSNGTANIAPQTGAWTYRPDSDYAGSDSFGVSLSDDDGYSTAQPISITIAPHDGDTTPPTVTAAVIDGDILTITLNEPLASTLPANRSFNVKNGTNQVEIDSISLNSAEKTVILNLASDITPGEDRLTLAYKDQRGDQSSGVIEDATGNDLNTFKAIPVANITSPDDKLIGTRQRNTLIAGHGAATFRRSKGKDTISEFSSSDSNRIEATESLELQLFQPGGNLLLKDNINTVPTALLNSSHNDLLGHHSAI